MSRTAVVLIALAAAALAGCSNGNWVAYFRLAEVKVSFEDVDKWVRRKLRGILWRQWKRPRTRIRELCRRGLDLDRARRSALNGRGPWWNAGASHMHAAVPSAELRRLGLVSLLEEHQRLMRPA